MTRVQLGKVTNEREKADAQVTLDILVGRLDKMEQARNMYKQRAKHYATVVRRLAGSSINAQPLAMVSVEDPTVKKAEKFASKGRVLYDFIKRIVEHGSQIIVVADEKGTLIAKLKTEFDKGENVLSQERREMEKCLSSWSQMKQASSVNWWKPR